jgi:hypothetical protein
LESYATRFRRVGAAHSRQRTTEERASVLGSGARRMRTTPFDRQVFWCQHALRAHLHAPLAGVRVAFTEVGSPVDGKPRRLLTAVSFVRPAHNFTPNHLERRTWSTPPDSPPQRRLSLAAA